MKAKGRKKVWKRANYILQTARYFNLVEYTIDVGCLTSMEYTNTAIEKKERKIQRDLEIIFDGE